MVVCLAEDDGTDGVSADLDVDGLADHGLEAEHLRV